MKNKILASLLAVCLFAGLAVPAFAKETSSVAGSGAKVSEMNFLEKEYTLKQDETKDFTKELRVFESKEKLVIDYQQITWELEGNDTNFTLDSGAVVTAINDKGTTTLIARDDQSKGVVAKTTIKAAPNPSRNHATSFKYENQTNIKIPAGKYAQDYSFTILPIQTGNYWTEINKEAVADVVINDINDILGLDGTTALDETSVAGDKASFELTVASAVGHATKKSVPSLTFVDPITKKNVVLRGSEVAAAAAAAAVASAFDGKSVVLGGVKYEATTAAAVVTFTAKTVGFVHADDMLAASDTAELIASPALGTAGTATVGNPLQGEDKSVYTEETVYFDGVQDENKLKFTIPGEVLRDMTDKTEYNVKKPVVSEAYMADRDNNNAKKVIAKTNVTLVPAKKFATIAMTPNKTIEVGETFNLKETVRLGASDANVYGSYGSWTENYYNDAATADDYAIVSEDGVVLGVAVGKNKISVTLENGATAYATIEVIKKGTKTPDVAPKMTSTGHPKMVVGGTHNITIADAGTATITYKVLAGDEAYISVNDKGTITAKAVTPAGKVAKAYALVDGKDIGAWVNVTVTTVPVTVEPPKPTTPPATGV